jgi:hypothetical protein
MTTDTLALYSEVEAVKVYGMWTLADYKIVTTVAHQDK